MDNIRTNKQGNFQTTFLHGQTLQGVNQLASLYIEKATDLLFTNHLSKLTVHYRTGNKVTTGRQIQLSELLMESHLIQQICNKMIHLYIFPFVRLRTRKEYKSAQNIT